MANAGIRDSRFELLRIAAMFLIMLQHSMERSFAGAWAHLSTPLSLNWVTSVIFGLWGQFGVMLFVIISSWFMADRQGISGKKLLMLVLQVWTTCVGLLAVFMFVPSHSKIGLGLIVKELITPIFQQYWFISVFLVFYILVPLMQKVVHALDDKALRSVFIVMTLLVPVYNYLFTNVGDKLADFIYIFFATAYLKRHPENLLRKHCRLFLVGMGTIAGSVIVYKAVLAQRFGDANLIRILTRLRGRTLLLFLTAMCLFYCFETMKPIYSRVINTIGSTTFGIYLLHENMLVRGEESGQAWLWNTILHMDEHFLNDKAFVPYYFGCVIGIFVLCILIDLIRQNTIERCYRSSRFLEKLGKWFDDHYGRII